MEQIKPYLAMLKKQHFWVLSSIVGIAAVVCWFMAASSLQAEFDANLAAIETKTKAVKDVAGKADHPNDKWQAGLKLDNDKQKADVLAAWEKRYQEQLKVPQWDPDALGKRFVDHIQEIGHKGEIARNFKEVYQNFIKDAMKPLFSRVDYRRLEWILDKDGKRLYPPGGVAGGLGDSVVTGEPPLQAGPGTEWKGLVAWPEASRFAFAKYYDWPRTPTTLQIRLANEDLWVTRALLDIIAKTNEGVTEHLVARVKAIDALNTGRFVPPPEQFLALLVPGAVEGAMTDDDGGGTAMPAAPGGLPALGGLPGAGGEGEAGGVPALAGSAAIDAELTHGRYVDSKGNPVAYNAPDPFAEFKIMPFQMLLVMDQRRIPELLVNCANSPLPIEVRQVKVTARTYQPVDVGEGQMAAGGLASLAGMAGGMGAAGGFAGGMGGFSGGMGSRGGDDGGGFAGGLGGMGGMIPGAQASALGGELELSNYDLNVEIRGVVYIFNYPDKTKLNTGAEQLNAAPPDPTQPAVTPPVVPPAAQPPAAGQTTPVPGPAPAAPPAIPPAATPPAAAPPAATPPAAVPGAGAPGPAAPPPAAAKP